MSARRKLIAELTDASHGSIPALADVDHAERLVNAHRAEVLTEAAEILRGRVAQYPTRRIFAAGLRHAVLVLAKVAMGRGKSSPTGADATPTFFEAGHTYRSTRCADLRFECLAVSADPDTEERKAIGWRYGPPRGGVRSHKLAALDAEDWACCGWTDAAERGEHR